MSKPFIHAKSSVRRYGGKVEDYLPIHELMDSSKQAIADNRHRALTHHSWFIGFIIPKIFGETFVNSDGKTISSRDIAEEHVLEDNKMKFIPSATDYLQEIEMKAWMQNGGSKQDVPPSSAKLYRKKKTEVKEQYQIVD